MVLYTRKQFGELCGKSAQQIGVAINRDGAVIEVNKKIDVQNPTNKAYLAKVTVAEVNKDIEKIHNDQKQTENIPQQSANKLDVSNIDYVLKQHQLKKIIIETNLKNLEYAKKKKKVLPLNLAATNINTFLIGTVGKVKNELDKFIENNFDDNDEVLKHKKDVHSIIEETIKNNIKNAIIEMEKEADEYSLITSW
jgi:hypothetical protein